MKRSRKAFVVEHKRRSRPAASTPPSIWTGAAGRQMRELALSDDETGALANSDAHEAPRARAAAAPSASGIRRRILEARVEPSAAVPDDVEREDPIGRSVVSGPSKPDASRLARPGARKASKPRTAKPDDDGSRAMTQRSGPTVSMEEPTATRSRPTAPGWRERRLALRKTLPLQDRWKWDQPF